MAVITKREKWNLWFKKWLNKADKELCKNCGKPLYAHFNRNMQDGFCEPYGLDVSKFKLNKN